MSVGTHLHGATQIMGVLNVTPDSFSDGGAYTHLDSAISHALEMSRQGADIIDVGGESTRPGAARIDPEEEQRRVLPVISALSAHGLTLSIDTVNASTAELAMQAGASMINDVSGGTEDPNMRKVAAATDASYIAMHWRGVPDPAHQRSHYDDIVGEVRVHLSRLADHALAAGISPDKLVLDPGFGFDKTAKQSWRLLSHLWALRELGYPLVVGVSRKRMIAEALAEAQVTDSLQARDHATAAVSALAAQAGAWAVRVHDVNATAAALAAVRALGADGNTSDVITLSGLEVIANHGVLESERNNPQPFVIDAQLFTSLHGAGSTDDLGKTVNYAELASALRETATRAPVDLIETLAERLAAVSLGFAGVREARVTVHKPQAPINAPFEDVSVTVHRTRTQGRSS